MLNLFSSGTKFQKIARQHNANLVQAANGNWYLYQDGQLVTKQKHPWDAIQFITNKL
jgi:hypothetical protein